MNALRHSFANPARRRVLFVINSLAGDERGLAKAWALLGLLHIERAEFRSAEDAWTRAAAHAHRSGDRRDELESLSWVPLAARVISKGKRTDETIGRLTGQSIIVRASADTPRQLDGDTVGPGRELRMQCVHGRLLVRVPR